MKILFVDNFRNGRFSFRNGITPGAIAPGVILGRLFSLHLGKGDPQYKNAVFRVDCHVTLVFFDG